MSADGGYGVMLQIPESTIQEICEAFHGANPALFGLSLSRQIPVAPYGVEFDVDVAATLLTPVITLVPGRTLELKLEVQAQAQLRARLDPLPGGGMQPPLPPLVIAFRGDVAVDIEAVFQDSNGRRTLSLDLEALAVTGWSLTVDHATWTASQETLEMLSAIVRRMAVVALTSQVKSVPVSWEFHPSLPGLSIPPENVALDYKIVSDGTHQALALLVQVNGSPVDWNAVRYALDQPQDVGIFLDLGLLNDALRQIDASLEHYALPVADLYTYGVRMHVQPGAFVIDSLKVQSRTVQQVVDTVVSTVCDAIDPCHLVCRKVAREVVHIIQLDEVFEVTGSLAPYVDGTHVRVHTDNLDIHISYSWAVAIFTAVDALLPLGGVISAVLVVAGQMMLDKTVDQFVNDSTGLDLLVDQNVPGTALRARAAPRAITWPDGTFALMGRVALGAA